MKACIGKISIFCSMKPYGWHFYLFLMNKKFLFIWNIIKWRPDLSFYGPIVKYTIEVVHCDVGIHQSDNNKKHRNQSTCNPVSSNSVKVLLKSKKVKSINERYWFGTDK